VRLAWRILLAVGVAGAVLLALNTIALDSETKPAEPTAEGGRILELSGGNVQVVDTPAQRPGADGQPIVLLHCYGCSLRWWDPMLPILSRDHRVIRVDLLGHGGSEKPKSGYEMTEQAALVAEALGQLDVEGAMVVGHSLGATVATALAESSGELVDRIVDIDQAPDNSFGSVSLLARLGYLPVIGELSRRLATDGLITQGYEEAFAPGFDVEAAFEDPDRVVEDYDAMTFTSFDRTPAAEDSYVEEAPLTERLTAAGVPLLVIFGDEDQVYDAADAIEAFESVPGVRTAIVEGAGHSPNVERPEQTARLILGFAD
jgi:pimeloyl-ACP methyl ester carboxylesterase